MSRTTHLWAETYIIPWYLQTKCTRYLLVCYRMGWLVLQIIYHTFQKWWQYMYHIICSFLLNDNRIINEHIFIWLIIGVIDHIEIQILYTYYRRPLILLQANNGAVAGWAQQSMQIFLQQIATARILRPQIMLSKR